MILDRTSENNLCRRFSKIRESREKEVWLGIKEELN
jgi:hypothetical protein